MIHTPNKKSRLVHSSQHFASRRIPDLLRRYQEKPFQAPVPFHTQRAFEKSYEHYLASGYKKLVVDLGCGTGESTVHLGNQHPDSFVIGIDRSAHRLGKQQKEPSSKTKSNTSIVRADGVGFIQLLTEQQAAIDKLYLLYPNPSPKRKLMKRRWPTHPISPLLFSRCQEIECRTNWRVYAFECAKAIHFFSDHKILIQRHHPQVPYISGFERKYVNSGHQIYRVSAHRFEKTAS